MSAILCGKRSIFEDLQSSPQSSPAPKRIRCSSSRSPVHPCPSNSSLVDQLRLLFPRMDIQDLVRTLNECGNDLDSAIKSLHELSLGHGNPDIVSQLNASPEKGGVSVAVDGNVAPLVLESPLEQKNFAATPRDGSEWVELLVNEMMNASSIDDARCRATKVLESLEKSIGASHNNTTAEATKDIHKENMMLKEQIELLLRDNTILKRAVSIQHERQKEYEDKNQEVQHLKQMISQYQEQMRTLEVNNYALSMHLQQAQQGNSIPGRFNPDIF
ncbi:uncharacterized protein LOC124936789 isoform X2 [Impatiens glandulifera]|uniref:uncharacterized protein LOC124936789 isoform X2 n=1 Tax=Impatiens glandulifera TaxID=253017 RepID=UPI001FB14850|nr:uncharacterized protein LOC124936789 isoform X2 [Impatiens glandulifera]